MQMEAGVHGRFTPTIRVAALQLWGEDSLPNQSLPKAAIRKLSSARVEKAHEMFGQGQRRRMKCSVKDTFETVSLIEL